MPRGTRRLSPDARALTVFDLDGTLTRHDTLIAYVAGYLRRHPRRVPRLLALLPALARYSADRDRGALKGALIHRALGGLERSGLEAWTAAFVPTLLQHGLLPEAREALERHRARGDRLVLLSASPDLYVPAIGHALGFDIIQCTPLRWHGERLDGRLAGANCRGQAKRECLETLIRQWHPREIVAYGNSLSDLDHMGLAQTAYLVNLSIEQVPSHTRIELGTRLRCLNWR